MNVSRLLLGLFGLAVAGAFFSAASGYPRAAAQMPMIYSVAVGLLSLGMLVDEVAIKRRRSVAPGTTPTEAGEVQVPAAPKRWLAVVVIFALAVGYVAMLTTLGYIVATGLFLALALLVLRTVRPVFALVGSAVLIGIVCLVFVLFLGLPIPLLPTLT
ncbi:tripartite tricarboxylate transporter TctB family protein [Salinicola rhizosphaerae]|uniref:DUF1468 domain-containing protein n=1 Tax=Salinicola rhizosphaerae TaxID=1443141 RepID=A0ABQ3DWW1_9GAMM|nr:tripartite tricarboxylate transporter TctB family protein [Salinicola rhizosphaerae]GHB17675.1 hypothetical protein GCM10009038_15690 [Salinicola rhizosphaerae]